jgi:hypothetical protein
MKRAGPLLPSRNLGDREFKSVDANGARVSHKNADASVFSDNSMSSILSSGPATNSQDLNLDWSKFENHTFFDSAAGKVNAAFLYIVNEFPFDGSKKEVFDFIASLTGFEKYVYDQFPKSIGFYDFAGSSHVEVKDSAGADFPDFSSDSSGRTVLDPAGGAFTLQMHLMCTSSANSNEVIAQYAMSENQGFTLFLSQSSSTQSANLCFTVCSGTLSASVSTPVEKGKFHHVAAVYVPAGVTSSLSLYRNGVLEATSSQAIWVGSSLGANMLSIASGSKFMFDGSSITPTQRLNAKIDDLRLYHSEKRQSDFAESSAYAGFAEDGLQLYYKFNEAPGNYAQESVVLDSSGNSLHTKIIGYSDSQRVTGSTALEKEDPRLNPVLFPDFPPTAQRNQDLLASGSLYDEENPNYIIRLVPQHYFLEGQQALSLEEVQGEIANIIQGNSIPGSGRLGSVQILTALLLMYAKVFDEIKIFHDHFSKLTYVDYDANNSVSDKFLTFLASYYGFQLPNLFPRSTVDQYLLGEKLQNRGVAGLPLRAVQDAIFRRILTNIREIVTAKGTHAGIRALFNAAGIAPNAFFRIREYGGPSEVDLSTLRDEVYEIASSLDMSGSLAAQSGVQDPQGFRTDSPRIISAYLSGSRTEVGFPDPAGSLVKLRNEFHGVSNQVSDGLLTSGSWSFEASYKYDTTRVRQIESLARLHVTGTTSPSDTHGVIFNIVATTGAFSTVNAYVASDISGAAPLMALHITGANVFDGNRWHVSLTRVREDDPQAHEEVVSSSYTLRCARVTPGGTATFFSASSYFDEGSLSNNALQNVSSYNTSGSFVVFGSQSIDKDTRFLNSTGFSDEVRASQFSGRVHSARFWSKALTDAEFKEHARSYRSLGVENPIVNFGFNSTSTGSFQKLRMDLSFDQDVTGSDSLGSISILDMSQQGRNGTGLGFEVNKLVIKPEIQSFTQISTRFDLRQTTDKVRVRSFTEAENLLEFPDALPAPLYAQVKSEPPVSDYRLAIEASAVDALNDDIIKLVATIDFFESAFGDPRVLNEDDYPDLEKLQRVYFNRLISKPDLKAMYEVFKWVSDSLGGLIVQLVPMNSTFLGISYIIESHIAERARVKYNFDSVYKTKTVVEQSQKNVQDPAGSTSQAQNTLVAFSAKG